MTREELLSRLSKLPLSQFEQVLYLARIPQEHLPGATAAQALRTVELMRYLELQNQFDQLAGIVEQVVSGIGGQTPLRIDQQTIKSNVRKPLLPSEEGSFRDLEISLENSPNRRSLLASVLEDLYRHFQHSRNPLLNSYYQRVATRNCIKHLPGKRMKTPEIRLYPLGKPWEPEPLWIGESDPKSIKILSSQQPIQISVHSMMVSTIAALLEMESYRDICLSISCPSSSSPRHILSLTDGERPCDILFTADAGVYTSAWDLTKRFRRMLTIWEETHLAISTSRNIRIKQVLVCAGTTQEIHHKLAADDGLLPKEASEEDIENLFSRAKDLSPTQAILLTYPKAQRILHELPFIKLSEETRGMTFGLYLRRDLRDDFQIAFLRAFVSTYNLCRQRFENGKMYRKQLLKKMSRVTGFLNNYGFGIFSEIRPDGIRFG